MANIYGIAAKKVMATYDLDKDNHLSKEEIKPFFIKEILTRPKNNLAEDAFEFWF